MKKNIWRCEKEHLRLKFPISFFTGNQSARITMKKIFITDAHKTNIQIIKIEDWKKILKINHCYELKERTKGRGFWDFCLLWSEINMSRWNPRETPFFSGPPSDSVWTLEVLWFTLDRLKPNPISQTPSKCVESSLNGLWLVHSQVGQLANIYLFMTKLAILFFKWFDIGEIILKF